jgi:hypothetical protein
MFMPNSPTPPSGTISSGGTSMPGESGALIRQQHPSVTNTRDPQPGSLVVKPGTRKRSGDHPGGWAVSGAAGAAGSPVFSGRPLGRAAEARAER